jgi:hypothetical protein
LKINDCRLKINVLSSLSAFFDALLEVQMNLRLLLVTVFFIGLVAVSFAGPPPPPPPNSGPPCWPPPCIPIDGGITLLMAAGAAFGAKKIYDSRKKIESND